VISGLGSASSTGSPKKATLDVLDLDRRTYDRALDCVHCGLCLPACPTYTENGLEADSPRGRIWLMKGLADGTVEPTAGVIEHLDLCLDCRACETACPSGVVYHELIEATREKLLDQPGLAKHRSRGFGQRVVDRVCRHLFPYPVRLKLSLLPARLLQRVGLWGPLTRLLEPALPKPLRKMQQMLPAGGPLWEKRLDERYPPAPPLDAAGRGDTDKAAGADHVFNLNTKSGRPDGDSGAVGAVEPPASTPPPRTYEPQVFGDATSPGAGAETGFPGARTAGTAAPPRMRVGFFSGCVSSVLFQDVNRRAIELLRHCGCEVVVPRSQACCGAITHHMGDADHARGLARQNLDAFADDDGRLPGVDAVVTCVAGCGAMLRDYGHLFHGDSRHEDAAAFAGKVRDISEVLLELDLRPTHAVNETVTYHDACHLAHAQKVTAAPRKLLARVPGLKLVDLPESDMCCGAAGTYNLLQPEMAGRLGQRKVRHIVTTAAPVAATGNVGCAMHIQSQADAAGAEVQVVHPVTLLHRATFGG